MRATLEMMRGDLYMELRDHKKLARLLVIQDVTHRDLAEVAQYKSHGHIGALVRGKKRGVEPEAALRIAMYLGVSVEDLFVTRVSTETGQSGQKVAA